jgi:hypothetical protein
MPGELNIIPEMCIRRDVIKKNDKLISDDLYVCTKVDPADERCIAYINPSWWCKRGGCPLSSVPSKALAEQAKKVNALKASKRAARGR